MDYNISNLHIGHANVIKFGKRTFVDITEMNNRIIENWNARVRTDDIVYILGDFIWAKESECPFYVGPLAGNKVLIRGNHDSKRFSVMTKKMFQETTNLKKIKANSTGYSTPSGNFINVGCMIPYMDYTPRTLVEIIEGDEEYLRSILRQIEKNKSDVPRNPLTIPLFYTF